MNVWLAQSAQGWRISSLFWEYRLHKYENKFLPPNILMNLYRVSQLDGFDLVATDNKNVLRKGCSYGYPPLYALV